MRLRRSSSSPSGKRALSVRPARVLAMIGAMMGVLAAQPSYAQTNVASFFEKVTFSGLVDAYYTYNFNKPAVGTMTPLRNFDVRHNQFSVALLEFAMEKPAVADDRVGFRFDLQYGQVAQIFSSDALDNNALVNVQQAYLSYLAPVGKGLTVDVGKFVTPIGSEPTEAHLNNNYSRAFWFALGPYYHVGARVSYPIHEKVTVGAMLVNGWNATGDNNSGKSVGATATITPHPKVTIVQNILWGPEQTGNNADKRTYSDTNLAVKLSDTVTTGLNYVYAKDAVAGDGVNWNGMVLYFRDQLTPVFAVAPRFEFFNDNGGLASGTIQKLKEFTLTGELKHSQGLIFRAEYRRDWSNIDYFVKDGAPVNNQNTFTLAFIVPFSSKS